MKLFDIMAILKMFVAYFFYMNIFDVIILVLGISMFSRQFYYVFHGQSFPTTKLEKVQQSSLYFCEFFPLAGLLGTMLGLLVTLSSMGDGKPEISAIMNDFAPALTSTVSGLLMLILNLFANYRLGQVIKA